MSPGEPRPGPTNADGIVVRMGGATIRLDRSNGDIQIHAAEPPHTPPRAETTDTPNLPIPTKRHIKLYAIYRDYLKHEDDLINNRLNWNLTVQGFLIASYSFSLQKIVEVKGNMLTKVTGPSGLEQSLLDSVRDLQAANVIIALVGLIVSGVIYYGTLAAQIAVEELEAKWHEQHPEYDPRDSSKKFKRPSHSTCCEPNTHGEELPGIIGGGNPKAHHMGFRAPACLPLIFGAIWAILLWYALRALLV